MSVYKEDKDMLSLAIESTLSQTYTDFEFIIVLDEPTNDEARATIKHYQSKDSRIVFIENEKNMNLAWSLNRAIGIAKGKYFARMDADDTMVQERFSVQVAYLDKHPGVDLLFTNWEEFRDQVGDSKNVVRRTKFRQEYDDESTQKLFFFRYAYHHPTLMCKRDVLIQHPYPVMEWPEDFSLFIDLIYSGYRFYTLEDVLYYYRLDRIDKSKNYTKRKKYAQNFSAVLIKNIPKFWHSGYFWLRLICVIVTYFLTRNYFVYRKIFVPAVSTFRMVTKVLLS